jgi:hypothetical protein
LKNEEKIFTAQPNLLQISIFKRGIQQRAKSQALATESAHQLNSPNQVNMFLNVCKKCESYGEICQGSRVFTRHVPSTTIGGSI